MGSLSNASGKSTTSIGSKNNNFFLLFICFGNSLSWVSLLQQRFPLMRFRVDANFTIGPISFFEVGSCLTAGIGCLSQTPTARQAILS